MFQPVSGVLSGVGPLSLFVGSQDHVDGCVSVGVDSNLVTGIMHFSDHLFHLIRLDSPDAAIAVAALVGSGEVGSAGSDSTVADHLDASQAQAVVPEARLQPRGLEPPKVTIVHKHVHAQRQLAALPGFLVHGNVVAGDEGVVDRS